MPSFLTRALSAALTVLEDPTICRTTRKCRVSWTFLSMRQRTSTGMITLIMNINTAFLIRILDRSLAGRLATGSFGSWIVGLVFSLQRTRFTTIVSAPMMLKLS
ncbi:hypothetical protein LINGRAHAP2_LOCUS17596 [Linum grandiflorum]